MSFFSNVTTRPRAQPNAEVVTRQPAPVEKEHVYRELIAQRPALLDEKLKLHERIMKTCICLSASFLIMYILYHMTSDPTPYGGEGVWRYVYFIILVTHIGLSVAVIPMVLFTLTRALAGNFERHRALAKFTLPVWLYVAVTGVIVYLMISPYYPK